MYRMCYEDNLPHSGSMAIGFHSQQSVFSTKAVEFEASSQLECYTLSYDTYVGLRRAKKRVRKDMNLSKLINEGFGIRASPDGLFVTPTAEPEDFHALPIHRRHAIRSIRCSSSALVSWALKSTKSLQDTKSASSQRQSSHTAGQAQD